MGLEIKQSLKLTQQLVMTPQLQQAIKLLQLSRLELAETIQEELLENPLLEISEENAQEQAREEAEAQGDPSPEQVPDTTASADETSKEEAAPELKEVEVEEQVSDEFDWENYLGEYSSTHSVSENHAAEQREIPSYENTLSSDESLKDHLLWQLRLSALSEEQQLIGELIIGNINQDGYLKASLENLSEAAESTPEEVETVLKVIQIFDPLGVAARDLRECLIVQASEMYPAHDLLHDILEDHLKELELGNFKAIAKKLKVKQDDIYDVLDIIRKLDPKPGRCISDEQPQYITPDIYIYKVDGEWVIQLNEDGLPKLKVNNFYKDAVSGDAGGDDAKEFVQNKLRSAMWLIRSIHQRQRTIYKVTESIIKFQKEFLDKGIAKLKPLVLRDVADDVGMHESTISRVTTNKYAHTPQGVFELKYFFNTGISRTHGAAMASEAVKDMINQIVSGENSTKPLSDQAIADILKKENIVIARRTVAKYREMLGILPSSRRRQPLRGRK